MLQAGDGFRFSLEAGALVVTRVVAGQDHLESDDSLQRQITCLIDDPHAAAAQEAQDLIAGKGG